MKILSETMSEPNEGRLRSFEPVYAPNSRVLILGTMASPASLQTGFYYGHPQNAFWKILSILCGSPLPETNGQKRALLLGHGVALWDTLLTCERKGAADSAIRRPVPADIAGLAARCPNLEKVFLNGGAAYDFYQKYHAPNVALPYQKLPSTSPANAKGGFDAKLRAWEDLRPFLLP